MTFPWDRGEDSFLCSLDGFSWPAALTPAGCMVHSYLSQIMKSQWWRDDKIRAAQRWQYIRLTDWVSAHSPFYRDRLTPGSGVTEKRARAELPPVLTRDELQRNLADIRCSEVPRGHGGGVDVQTSGSTGRPVTVRKNAHLQLVFMANTMREHYWHRREFARSLAVIRAGFPSVDGPASRAQGWGPPVSELHRCGPGYSLPMSTDVSVQASWLLARKPGYLITYPTNLAALIREFDGSGESLRSLQQVCTVGESVPPSLRHECLRVLGCPLVDTYSSNELGCIASQCPDSEGTYHVSAESLVVEILREDGSRCEEGEPGRVVVTDLQNFATPLIRYDTGDVAAADQDCECGRGLPALSGIIGRTRNMVLLPGGRRHWPEVGFSGFRDLAPVTRYQVVQRSLEEVDLLVEADAPLSPEAEASLSRAVAEALGHPFRVSVIRGDIASPPGDKFEEFVCKVPLDEGLP